MILRSALLCFLVVAPSFALGERCAQNQVTLVACSKGAGGLLVPTEARRSTITSLNVFAWWWSQEQLRLGLNKRKGNRPKSYVELKEWKETRDPTIPHPDHIEVVYNVETGKATGGHAVLEITTDYLVAPVDYACKKNIETITDEVSWSGEVRIFKVDLGILRPNSVEKTVKHFDLTALRQRFAGTAQSDSLWLWKLRFHAFLKKGGQTIARNEAVVSLLPRDGVCAK